MSTIGDNIRSFRTFRGLSQKALGDKLGKSANVVSNWETGTHSPDLDTTEKLCQVLDVTPNELFGWETNLEYDRWLEDQTEILEELNKMSEEKNALEARMAEYTERLRGLNKDKL